MQRVACASGLEFNGQYVENVGDGSNPSKQGPFRTPDCPPARPPARPPALSLSTGILIPTAEPTRHKPGYSVASALLHLPPSPPLDASAPPTPTSFSLVFKQVAVREILLLSTGDFFPDSERKEQESTLCIVSKFQAGGDITHIFPVHIYIYDI